MPNAPETIILTISHGFAPDESAHAARLFWQAFRGKLSPVLAPEDKAIRFLTLAMCPAFAIAARDANGRLLGLAGYKTGQGGLVGGTLRDLARVYGLFGSIWRGVLLTLLERKVMPGTLLMDGIFVAEEARGLGVGSALLDAVKARARQDGMDAVRLAVIDSNPRARALYERHGFVAGAVTHFGPLSHLFGFRSSTEMHCPL